jgi:hypothetical protein
MKIYQSVQKILMGDTDKQTDDLISLQLEAKGAGPNGSSFSVIMPFHILHKWHKRERKRRRRYELFLVN